MLTFQLLLLLIAACVLVAALASRMRIPPAVALVLGGMAIALAPGRSPPPLDPELTLALFLPPILQASAYRTDWRAFRLNLKPILLLAVGAVVFTTAIVAVVVKALQPGLPWAAAVALGAIVSPPDAVAATSVLRRLAPPAHLVTILEGESLINDASALILVRLSIALAAAGSLSFGHGALLLAGGGVGGAILGYLVGRAALVVFRWVDDTLLDIVVSILTGFAGYFAAEAIGASGVLAAVACGYVLGTRQHLEFTARTRLDLVAVWATLEFLLTSLLFLLIGLQLRDIIEHVGWTGVGDMLPDACLVCLAVVLARFAWVFVCAGSGRGMSRTAQGEPRRWRDASIISWAGMRGVVSLAAALALPAAFPQRDFIVFAAFAVIFVTLVVQGTTLGALVRRLGQAPAATPLAEMASVRAEVAAAALDVIEEKLEDPEEAAAAGELVGEYEERAAEAARLGEAPDEEAQMMAARLRLRLEGIAAARARLAGRSTEVDAPVLLLLSEELDLEERQIRHLLDAAEHPGP